MNRKRESASEFMRLFYDSERLTVPDPALLPAPRRKLSYDKGGWRKIRARVLSRDGHRCQDCGSVADLHVHHIKLYRIERSHEESNLVTVCRDCHSSRHGRAIPTPGRNNSGDQR